MTVDALSTPARGDTPFRVVCTGCRRVLGPGFVSFCAGCGGMADIEYDLTRVALHDDANPYRRFADMLPVADASLLPADATPTPTVHATTLGNALGIPRLYLKDETRLPTGTTKDRMAAVALAYLYERGVRRFCTSSTGNSSTAFAHAIWRIPELVMYLFTAAAFRDRVQVSAPGQVVHVVLRDATFEEAFDAARHFARHHGITSEGGFFNPGRREGLKLAWLEAVEQVPQAIDVYVQAVSSAMGVHGVFKGAKELHALGRIDRVPRLVCVQQNSCAPMVSAWRDGAREIRPEHVVARPAGIASAILRGNPTRAYPHVRRCVLESGGTFVAVGEDEIRDARRLLADLEGIDACFAASAAVAGVARLKRLGELSDAETVLVNLTGRDRSEPSSVDDACWLKREDGSWVPEDPRRSIPAPVA